MNAAFPRGVLVTGANGFVGQALCRQLLASGYHVRGAMRSAKVSDLPCETVAVGEIHGQTSWDRALAGMDIVVHLAAQTPDKNDHAKQSAYSRVNVDGTARLAETALACGVRRLIYVSSIKVNGESTEHRAFSAADEPAPEDAYGISKWQAEQVLWREAAEKMEIVILRPPLIHGPGVKGNLAQIMNWLQKGMPLPLGAVRDNRRSLVALDNLVDLIRVCLDHPAAADQVFLVSDDEDVSTTELIERLAQAMHRPARLFPVPTSWLAAMARLVGKQEIVQRLCGSLQVDISQTRSRLEWTPPVSLDEGLRRMVIQDARK